jgi:hypothetical protein
MKILVDREELERIFRSTDKITYHGILTREEIRNKIRQILEVSPVVTSWTVAGEEENTPRWNAAPVYATVSRQELQEMDDMLKETYGKTEEERNTVIFDVRKRIHKMLGVKEELPRNPCYFIDNEKCEACWGNHHNAIIDILDMLGEYANDGNAGPGQPVLPRRDLHMRDKCYKLQRKLTGKK